MSIHVALHHKTHYRYDRWVSLGPQVVRLRPAPHCRTPILSYSLKIRPHQHFINWQQDPQSNYLARLVFPEKTKELFIEVDLVAKLDVLNPFDFFLEPGADLYPFTYDAALGKELRPYLEVQPPGPLLGSFLENVPKRRTRSIDFLVELNRCLQQQIQYVIRLAPGVQSCEETLHLRRGSCRDSGWLLVQVLRHLGLAARFVSGYLIQLTPDVKPLDGPAGPTTDFTDLHAWTEVYLPGAGWIGLDPTSGLLAGEGHIPLACSPDPPSAAPVTGAVDPCETDFSHAMSVQRIHEAPRVTKPYTEEQWLQIEALGRRVDADLEAGDVRLTMGGEPTFVSTDDMAGDEWNTTALGPTKRILADELMKRLKLRFAPGGLLHYGQGKWYPGESLPRWAFSCYWRKDGVPLWRDPSLLADETVDCGHTDREALRFITALAALLEVDPCFSMAGYEDVWYYLWKERRLPVNVDPLASELTEPEERLRLAKVFEQGLGKVVGYVLPLRREGSGSVPRWVSGQWFLRPESLFLIPGDSPMGYRLPLDSLPWVSPSEYPAIHEADLFAVREALPGRPDRPGQPFVPGSYSGDRGRRFALRPGGPGGGSGRETEPQETSTPWSGQSAPWIVRTALCVESRSGRLHVFMPPIEALEDYIDLVAAVEDAATEQKIPVVIEGYLPPPDTRLKQLKVTPDPGVIEVNVHPASSWNELVETTEILYDEARQTRLGTEKFMLDGRHVGTGGGNHVVIGGATPADSPLLRRPDLLRSLLSYWHNHPSLSYLFAGLFIGPTSQHPRVDEARNDAVYEIEIAFQQLAKEAACPPWHVDRVLRNLLADVTGNTHRSEFCIDKLFPPESSSSRLGLVELRSFEMPPHPRMSLTQQLLLRALIARFWKAPYKTKWVRWGTALHDRFLLPHFVTQDFQDVLMDLQASGYPMASEWFAPHFEFRFPLYGSVNQRGVHLELRHALEPWHVLGEESGGAGTVRYVDSSVERLQIKVNGMTDTRHVVTCNGRRVPLYPTGTNGEFVAGVRYRAWQPPACLHPTIPVHSPLAFDIVDRWSGRSSGGCTYHVVHPGGRNFETFPVNAYEAESRRLARFFDTGHTPGPMNVPAEERNPEFPLTLDLRNAV